MPQTALKFPPTHRQADSEAHQDEIEVSLHEDNRVTVIRRNADGLYYIFWDASDPEQKATFLDGLRDWIEAGRSSNWAWQAILENPDWPIEENCFFEAIDYYRRERAAT